MANASPFTRQKKLEYAVESRIADAFFSLHCEGEEDAIYVSEVAERATVSFHSPGRHLLRSCALSQLIVTDSLLDRISTSVSSSSLKSTPPSLDSPV